MRFNPILFDVSLRDGIQGANPDNYPTTTKKDLMKTILTKYSPQKIEIGSFVSPKVLPIMKDTPELFDFSMTLKKDADVLDIYALVPNKKGLVDAMQMGVQNFSFITSVSDEFQLRNTRRSIEYKKTELEEMMNLLRPESKTKLYISCIDECPIRGPIDSDVIIHEILTSYGLIEYKNYRTFDEICLSDTMGTLKLRDFEYIVDGLIRFGVAKNRISVHLHVDSKNESDAKLILFSCFQKGITRFDVSSLLEGGCSVSMGSSKLKPNMTYEFFFDTLEEYNEL